MADSLREELKKEKICNYCGKKYTGWGRSGFPLVADPLRICNECSTINFAKKMGFKLPPKKEKEEDGE